MIGEIISGKQDRYWFEAGESWKSSLDADKLREIRGFVKPAPILPWKTETITEMRKLWNSH